MGWFSQFLGAPKIVETVADTVKGGMTMLDKAFYTDQEKAENANKYMDIWLKLQMTLANDNSVSASARRLIAFLVVGAFVFLVVFAAVVWKVDKEWAKFILTIIIDGYLGYLVMGICGTFFTFYGIGKYISKDNIPASTASIDNPPDIVAGRAAEAEARKRENAG